MIQWLTNYMMQLVFAGLFLLNATMLNSSNPTFSKPHNNGFAIITEPVALKEFDVSNPHFIYR